MTRREKLFSLGECDGDGGTAAGEIVSVVEEHEFPPACEEIACSLPVLEDPRFAYSVFRAAIHGLPVPAR